MRRAGGFLAAVLAVALVLPVQASAEERPGWKVRIDEITRGKDVGVSVRLQGRPLYARDPYQRRVPASNEKLLLTMALYDAVSPGSTIITSAAAKVRTKGTIEGNLWVIGRGDPSVTGGARFGKQLPFRPSHLALLARRLHNNGIRRVTGRVKGAIAYFSHDWWARGWESHFASTYAPLASGLSFEGNRDDNGRHISDPEVRAARYLTRRLRALGVRVAHEAGAGSLPGGTKPLASITSVRLYEFVGYSNRKSSNYFAETLGKRLSVASGVRPGTIAGGGRAIERWASARGVNVTAYDGSGLSYDNRVSPAGMTVLLEKVRVSRNFNPVRLSLPRGGQGTLDNRLTDVLVRAKTGTLKGKSALSGYVYLERPGRWASFSILSKGTSKATAVEMENRIVRVLAERANH